MDINCTLTFDYRNQSIIFTDSIGSSHSSQLDARGILRISTSEVVLYENKGWDDESFLYPDTFSGNWEIEITKFNGQELISLLSSTEIKIEYKLTNDGTGNLTTSAIKNLSVVYEEPVPQITIEPNYSTGKIVVTDETDYGTNFANLNEDRVMKLIYPEDSGLNTITSPLSPIQGQLGSVVGLSKATLLSYPKYRFTSSIGEDIDLVIVAVIETEAETFISSASSQINPFNCLSKLALKYEEALLSESKDALVYGEKLKELTIYTILYKYALSANLEYTFFANRIYQITEDCDCSITTYDGGSANDTTVQANMFAYLEMQLKEYYQQRNVVNNVADQRLSVINMMVTWYTIYSLAGVTDKPIPLSKINYYINDYVADEADPVVDETDYTDCISAYISCINAKAKQYEDNKLNNTEMVYDLFRTITDMTNFFQLFLIGGDIDRDKTYACDIMKELNYGCECESGSGGGSTPPDPTEDMFILWGNVPNPDSATIEDVEALANKEQRTDRFGVITSLDSAGNYPAIVMPSDFASQGYFMYNNFQYGFTKVATLSYTDENTNTYDVDVFVWPTQNYGVWTQITPL